MAQNIPPTAQLDADVEERVESLLSQMSLEEKVDLIAGVDFFYLRGVPRLGVPRLRMADGPMGLRNDGPAIAYPGGISLAASWNRELVEAVGVQLGRDARAKGVHVLLAPGVNIYRASIAARNFEYFGEDPYLAARMAVGFIDGVQSQGVSATIKHFVANNSEYDRNHSDSIVDERALREIYLPAFEAAVKEANVGAIMDGYNLTNGSYMSQHAYLNNEVVKAEWDFRGVIMSDWISTYDAIGAANGGLDIEMPSGSQFNRENLLPAIEAGDVSAATLDDKVRRILRLAVRFGWPDREQLDESISRENPQGAEAALQAAREGIVLLKNDAVLPLDRNSMESILVVGPNAHPAIVGGGGSSRVEPFAAVSILDGLSKAAGPDVTTHHTPGLRSLSDIARTAEFTVQADGREAGLSAEYFAADDLSGDAVVARIEPFLAVHPERDDATFPDDTHSGRWAAYYTVEEKGLYDLFVAGSGDNGGYNRVFVDDELVIDNWGIAKSLVDEVSIELEAGPHKLVIEQHGRSKWPYDRLEVGITRRGSHVSDEAKALAAGADVIVVVAGYDPGSESEGADRSFRLPPGQDELIETMVATAKPVVVILITGGAVDTARWLDDVSAVLQAWYPGQEGGTAVADILFGDINPSGRLPATFERRWEESPAYDDYYPEPGSPKVLYEDGIYVGYRGYQQKGIEPLFPFGYGLSYTSFEYSELEVSPENTGDGIVQVSFDVTNTGNRAGGEVAQVYVGDTHSPVDRPASELKGFAKVFLGPGETQRVMIGLNRRSFSYYDVEASDWRATPGVFDLLIGRSSATIELRGKVRLTE